MAANILYLCSQLRMSGTSLLLAWGSPDMPASPVGILLLSASILSLRKSAMSTNSPFSTFLTSLAGTMGSASLSMKGPSPSDCSLPSACGWSGTCGVGLSPTAATVVPSPINDGSPRSRTEDSSGSLPSRNATGREKEGQ